MAFRDLFDSDPRSKKDLRRDLELRDESVSALRREAQEQALKGKRTLELHSKDLSGLAASVQASKDREQEALRSLAEAKRALGEAHREIKQLKSGSTDELRALKERLKQAEKIASELEFEVRNLNHRIPDAAKPSRGALIEAHREIR